MKQLRECAKWFLLIVPALILVLLASPWIFWQAWRQYKANKRNHA